MESTFEKIQRKTGTTPNDCKCQACKLACNTTAGLGTPEDIIKIIEAGFKDKIAVTDWHAGVRMGLIKEPVTILAPYYDKEKGACSFLIDGLCELHDLGLKPTECRLSHHSTRETNWNAKKSISWQVVKEWLDISLKEAKEIERLYT